MYRFLFSLFFTLATLTSLFAQLKLASIFTDNMVLQQQSKVSIWGWTSASKTVRVTSSWDKKTITAKADANGRWKINLQTPSAGGPYQVTISDGHTISLKNILIGEVWLCSGQSNMEMPMKGFKGQPITGSNEAILKSTNRNIRVYTVPRGATTTAQENSKPSVWKEAAPEAISNFSATAYYFGKELNELLNTPIGLINVSYGGSPIESWMDTETLAGFPEIKLPLATDSIKSPNRTPTALYNAMLHPVIGYGIKGIIWYQGESNYDRPDQYETVFPAMVKQWRTLWQAPDLPFYFTQIAPYNYAQLPPYSVGGKYNSAYLRDAQRKSVDKIPNSAMAVVLDAGEENNIHPANKKVVGERLALLALAKTYGLKGFGYESPTYDTLSIANGIVEAKFKNAGNWLTSYGKGLQLFEIAGKDKIFYPAKAVIYRSSVMVSSPQVKEPVAVRYAFKDFTTGELFSTEGLPVSSFRTDNW
ncbi:MAG: sialate O-acetylesterase [Chitinophagaceae bacterium]|nr:MAG: sialate O-acetylesterase [Chitinophagaceae bacterium]